MAINILNAMRARVSTDVFEPGPSWQRVSFAWTENEALMGRKAPNGSARTVVVVWPVLTDPAGHGTLLDLRRLHHAEVKHWDLTREQVDDLGGWGAFSFDEHDFLVSRSGIEPCALTLRKHAVFQDLQGRISREIEAIEQMVFQ